MHRFIIMRCQCVEEEDWRPLFSQTLSWHMPSAEKCEQCLLKRQYKLLKCFWTQRTKCWFSKGWSKEILIHFTSRNIKLNLYDHRKKEERVFCVSVKYQKSNSNLYTVSSFPLLHYSNSVKPRRPQMPQRL